MDEMGNFPGKVWNPLTQKYVDEKPKKMGDFPVPVVLTRDQIRYIRGLISSSVDMDNIAEELPLLSTLNNAEDRATILHAERCQPKIIWFNFDEMGKDSD